MLKFAKKARDLQPKNSLKFLLHKSLSGFEEGRPLKNIHASALTKPEGLCPRYYALHDVIAAPPKDEWVDTASRITWAQGNDLQTTIVNAFADMKRLMGHWECMNCKLLYEFS